MPIVRRKHHTYATPGISHAICTDDCLVCRPEVTNTRCRIGTVFSPDDGHIVARNMQIKAINLSRKFFYTKLVLFTRCNNCNLSHIHQLLSSFPLSHAQNISSPNFLHSQIFIIIPIFTNTTNRHHIRNFTTKFSSNLTDLLTYFLLLHLLLFFPFVFIFKLLMILAGCFLLELFYRVELQSKYYLKLMYRHLPPLSHSPVTCVWKSRK